MDNIYCNNQSFLFVTLSLGGGGAERAMVRYANALVKRGHRVRVYSYERASIEYEIDTRVEVTYSKLSRTNGNAGKLQKYWEDARAVRQIYRSERFDYVIPFCTEMVICTSVGLMGTDACVIATERNNPIEGCKGAVKRRIRDEVYKRCSAIWVQNDSQGEFYRKLTDRPVFTIPNIVVCAPLIHLPSTPIVKFINVGRLAPQKNQRMLIEAFAKASCVHPEIVLDIFGEGPLKDDLAALIESKGLSERIQIRGYTDRILEELSLHDAFLFTSDYEGLPNALIEAMLIGLPVAITDFETGSADLVENGVTGTMVARGDTEAFAAAICKMTENPKNARKLALNAIDALSPRYSEEGLVALLLKSCREIENVK